MKTIELNEQQVNTLKYFLNELIEVESRSAAAKTIINQILAKLEHE